jgi:hypothetical protein
MRNTPYGNTKALHVCDDAVNHCMLRLERARNADKFLKQFTPARLPGMDKILQLSI